MEYKDKMVALESDNQIVLVYLEIAHLKNLFRQGWLQSGIDRSKCESVADHSFMTAILAWMIAEQSEQKLDLEKVLKMSLLHEVGEIYGGDITPNDQLGINEKFLIELDSMKKVLTKFPNSEVWCELWQEFERGKSSEAKFVKQIDKLEMALQAYIYEQNRDLDLKGFYKSAAKVIDSPEIKAILDEVYSSE